jgi:hypothetical protein
MIFHQKMNIIDEIKKKLQKYDGVVFEEDINSIKILPSNSDGFEVGIEVQSSEYWVYFEGWHEHFKNAEEALNCLAFGLSTDCRLKVVYKGNSPHKWIVQCKEYDSWIDDSETGLILFPFWKSGHIEYKQNTIIQKK